MKVAHAAHLPLVSPVQLLSHLPASYSMTFNKGLKKGTFSCDIQLLDVDMIFCPQSKTDTVKGWSLVPSVLKNTLPPHQGKRSDFLNIYFFFKQRLDVCF